MEALRIIERVSKNGLHIGIENLHSFENTEVEVIILPVYRSTSISKKQAFLESAGEIDIDHSVIAENREKSLI